MNRTSQLIAAAALGAGCAGTVSAGFTLYSTDFEGWQTATGAYETLDFTGFPLFTLITDQYADQGVTFLDGTDFVLGPASFFPLDNWGINVGESATLQFDTPQYSFGLHHPGTMRMDLFLEGELVYHSPPLPGGGTGWFVGIVSTTPFDEVFIYDVDGVLAVDNIYFGVPAPAAGLVLLGLPLAARRRRRSAHGSSPS